MRPLGGGASGTPGGPDPGPLTGLVNFEPEPEHDYGKPAPDPWRDLPQDDRA